MLGPAEASKLATATLYRWGSEGGLAPYQLGWIDDIVQSACLKILRTKSEWRWLPRVSRQIMLDRLEARRTEPLPDNYDPAGVIDNDDICALISELSTSAQASVHQLLALPEGVAVGSELSRESVSWRRQRDLLREVEGLLHDS